MYTHPQQANPFANKSTSENHRQRKRRRVFTSIPVFPNNGYLYLSVCLSVCLSFCPFIIVVSVHAIPAGYEPEARKIVAGRGDRRRPRFKGDCMVREGGW